MQKSYVRLLGVEIKNLKNVQYGAISFFNSHRNFKASILGLYGQNGSGKTVLIDAIHLLKFALSGQPIPPNFADFISVGTEMATIQYNLSVTTKETKKYIVTYVINIRKKKMSEFEKPNVINNVDEYFKTIVFDEMLYYSDECANGQERKQMILDMKNSNAFGSPAALTALVKNNETLLTDLIVAKKLAAATSRSYCFSKELLRILNKYYTESVHLSIINSLVSYGTVELFVIMTTSAGLISMDALPLAFKYEAKNTATVGNIAISLNDTTKLPQNVYNVVLKVIDVLNIVLKQIVPGLTIKVKKIGTKLLKNGRRGVNIQLISQKNSKEIPLKYESEGIKKLISILHLFIVIYNNPSITVAIDELDSGIFEYLLGELLRIVSERGRGQLIFTSHNLRPLETLDHGFVALTTTDPAKRYIRFNNIQDNENLRDFYYRDIMLGEQDEIVYEPTDNEEIAFAFRKAGELSGT